MLKQQQVANTVPITPPSAPVVWLGPAAGSQVPDAPTTALCLHVRPDIGTSAGVDALHPELVVFGWCFCLQELLEQVLLEVLPQLAPLAALSQGCCQSLSAFCGLAAAAASPRDSITAFLEAMDQLLTLHRWARETCARLASAAVFAHISMTLELN